MGDAQRRQQLWLTAMASKHASQISLLSEVFCKQKRQCLGIILFNKLNTI